MDNRCPLCGVQKQKTKFGQSMVPRMVVQCSTCQGIIHLNVHRVETIVVLLNFAIIIVLAIFAYYLQSRELVLVVVGAAMVGASALPLLERTYLRSWPRYVAKALNAKR